MSSFKVVDTSIVGTFSVQSKNSITYFMGTGSDLETNTQSGFALILSLGEPVIIGLAFTTDIKSEDAFKLLTHVSAEVERKTGAKPLISETISLITPLLKDTFLNVGIINGIMNEALGEVPESSKIINWELSKRAVKENATLIYEWLSAGTPYNISKLDDEQIESDWAVMKDKMVYFSDALYLKDLI